MVTRQPCSNYDALSAFLTKEYFTIYDNRCIEINLRPYLAPRLEYQYPGESKQIIYSTGGELSYTTKTVKKQCSGVTYAIEVQPAIIRNGTFSEWGNTALITINEPYSNDAPYSNVLFLVNINGTESIITNKDNEGYLFHWRYSFRDRGQLYTIQFDTVNHQNVRRQLTRSRGYRFLGFKQIAGSYCPPDCQFTITESFSNGTSKIRHQETRNVCPTVQQFDCELSTEVQTIIAEAKPFEVFFISDGYEFGDGLINSLRNLIDTSKIDAYLRGNPINCFLLWKLRRQFGISFDIVDVAQVCSASGCPPPEMNYRCLNCCESCPDNTCPVECGDHVCCYDESGKAVKEIPKENYCNE